MRQSVRRVAIALLLACGMLLRASSVAWAHANLSSAEPAAGSRLGASPPRIRLVFSEPVEGGMAQFLLAGSDGETRKLKVAADPRDVHALVAPVDALPAGAYRMYWRVVSADGHAIDGSYVFAVGATSATAPPLDAALINASDAWGPQALGAPLVPAALRGAAVGALMALAGLLLFLVLPRAADDVPPQRALRLAGILSVASPVLVAAHAAAWLVNMAPDHVLSSDWASMALASGVGRIESARAGCALLALWALALARRRGLALVFAVAALAISGATGHSAAIVPVVAVPMKALHLLAAAAWLGGLLYLLLRERGTAPAFARDARRVSAIALGAVMVVTVSGVVQTWLFLPAPSALLHSSYGAVTLAKIGGLLGLIGFGAYHRFRVLPRVATDAVAATGFAGSLSREVTLMSAVVLIGGLLAYVPTPGLASEPERRDALEHAQMDSAGHGGMSLDSMSHKHTDSAAHRQTLQPDSTHQ